MSSLLLAWREAAEAQVKKRRNGKKEPLPSQHTYSLIPPLPNKHPHHTATQP
jgi:hypothetical protein